MLNDNVLEGPEIERMVGLPPGAALDVSIWGNADNPFGQMEIIDYRGVEGADLYPRAMPRQRGILHVTYAAADLEELIRSLDGAGIAWTDKGAVASLSGAGRFTRFRSPAGFQIQVFQPQ